MSGPPSRIRSILGHLLPQPQPPPHIHHLSPTFFLERAALVEPNADAILHITTNGVAVRRSYQTFADRARGLAYYLKKHKLTRIGILAPNTPAFLESIYGIVAGGGVVVPANYRLKEDDIAYIFEYAEVDCIIVDKEFETLLGAFTKRHPKVPLIVDLDTDATEGPSCGQFNEAILEGLAYDKEQGGHAWAGLQSKANNEDDMLAIPFTSGTTSRPKGVVYTHRGAYLAAMGNIIESGLNQGRCRYLWTLPMFHAMGWTFPWSVVAVRGLNVCLRKIDYPLIWKLLKEEGITHFNAAPTVNTLLVAAKEATKLPNPVQVTVAASPPSGHLFEQMTNLNLMPVHVYGMTETYGPITKCYHLPEWDNLPPQQKYAKMARQGHGFVTSLPIRIVKPDQPDGVLIDVAKNGQEIGEIVFFGNICAKEYYKDAEASRKLFAGGALHSGDLAVWHPDGSAQILDRAKDIIISGGENISSVALESMLVQHPDILEAGVVAVPDDHWGETPKAYVTVKEGKTVRGEDVISWAKHQSNISKFMVPKEVEVVKELPKTSTGKIKKNDLRDWAKKGSKS
ncbi:AMP-binding domain-containing protein [Pochonia chlamydosporia 170]|uniref:AMP-binding domain-containing protein n=1 Tax=Pochonia chlamydosporia 170 TaxID=1380566 RepID=A0A179FX40_METCM|nr:AMP-binding domain-containing protein [Pochonia chlamydosporia 170]OAQ70246.1 AMP-binding domain-containing protein [Pochonia chlamydosporia 170]